ncbi:FUSC family protein [Paraburkholderia megapolitana]|uniref:Multidrug resistance protein MdtO n=1 Tax=Paraburkholderia megapolitana TaxID=420953 RepID=A0A1I3E2Y4_9BURK|nr:FUSC family protein [Paraburkholderia megapolitana]QDQ79891.1 FUSC family protein [Paraburkholderia megapolitana]SFH93213.1 multidrug resistance protein MdtO [Paraburkholderia megapolitana]
MSTVTGLRRELTAFPGRSNVTLRCVLGSAIVIVASMTLSVPELALSLMAVFYVTQSNVVLTRMIALGLVIGTTCAIAIAAGLYRLTFDYPLLRLVVASAIFFCSVYLMRAATKFGLVFFLIAIIVIYAQSFVDLTDNAEALVRSLLWVWSAVNYPVVVALIINTILLPAEPEKQLRAAMHRQLVAVQVRLSALVEPTHVMPVALDAGDLQQGATSLQKLLRFSTMRTRYSEAAAAAMLACVTTVSRLYEAAAGLPATAQQSDAAGIAAIRSIQSEVAALDAAITEDVPLQRPIATRRHDEPTSIPAVAAMQRAIEALADATSTQAAHAGTPPPAPPALLPPDAFSNPRYARFALRTLLSVLICYVFYNAVNWPGIHTIMLTCLVVALPSLGASSRHGLLRLSGALIGSGLALFMVAFVIPHLESVTGLLLMSLPVIALGAWVSAGSERISYAGLQMMFTFSLALLEQFAPPSDLTEIRDRLVGILLGVGVATFIQMSVWPEGEADALRAQLSKVVRAIAALARGHAQAAEAGANGAVAQAQSASTAWAMLADCEATLARVALEPDWREGETARVTLLVQTVLVQSRSILLASDAFHDETMFDAGRVGASGAGLMQACGALQRSLGDSLERYAQQLSSEPPLVTPPVPLDLTTLTSVVADRAAGERSAALLEWATRIDAALAGLPKWSTDEVMSPQRVDSTPTGIA